MIAGNEVGIYWSGLTVRRGGRRGRGGGRWSRDSPTVPVGAANSSAGTLARKAVCMTCGFVPKTNNIFG